MVKRKDRREGRKENVGREEEEGRRKRERKEEGAAGRDGERRRAVREIGEGIWF